MRNQNKNFQSGFTIIELLVVVAIMAIIATIGIINWNSERSSRTLNIAQNETSTNIRKVQSYAVSSKDSPSGPVKFYLLRFQKDTPSYTVQAVTGTDYSISTVETIALPSQVTVSNIVLEVPAGPGPSGQETLAPDCIDVIFSASYGKTYFTSDNNNCGAGVPNILKSLPVLAPKANYNLTLTLDYKGLTRSVKIYGLNGKVESLTP